MKQETKIRLIALAAMSIPVAILVTGVKIFLFAQDEWRAHPGNDFYENMVYAAVIPAMLCIFLSFDIFNWIKRTRKAAIAELQNVAWYKK